MPQNAPELSIVIPCYNEEACIESVVRTWIAEISKRIQNFELVLIDDGSKDRTPEILKTLSAELPTLRAIRQVNQGHGPALLHGYHEARGDWVFHTDSDAQFIPEDFWLLWDRRKDAPHLMGIRKARKDPLHRLILTRVLRFLVRTITGIPVKDINIPYKLTRGDLLKELLISIPPDTLAPSILLAIGAHRRGVRIIQWPVTHLPRTTGQTVLKPVKLTKFCWKAFGQLLRYIRSDRYGYGR